MTLSPLSLERLSTCDERLQELFKRVAQTYPCVILEGHRNQADQDRYFAEGKSQLKWPNGNHNSTPSRAVDVAPLTPQGKVDWTDKTKFYHFIGYVTGMAEALGLNVRSGGDWNQNMDLKDQKFVDLPHFEIKD